MRLLLEDLRLLLGGQIFLEDGLLLGALQLLALGPKCADGYPSLGVFEGKPKDTVTISVGGCMWLGCKAGLGLFASHWGVLGITVDFASSEVRTRVPPFFRMSILIGEPSPKRSW